MVCGRAQQHSFTPWAGRASPLFPGCCHEPGGRRSAGRRGLCFKQFTKSPLCFSCPVFPCSRRQMRRGRRRRCSPQATRSPPCCRHLWSPHHRYSPSLLPSQPPPAPRASGSTAFPGVGTGKLQVVLSICISKADLCREYTRTVLLISPSLSLWWQSLLCLVFCWLWLPSGNPGMNPANAFNLALVSGQTLSVPRE